MSGWMDMLDGLWLLLTFAEYCTQHIQINTFEFGARPDGVYRYRFIYLLFIHFKSKQQ